MSTQSDAAKEHIEKLLEEKYPNPVIACIGLNWIKEYRFAPPRQWRFDYAVPAILCANPESTFVFSQQNYLHGNGGVIELDGGTFKTGTGHNSGVGLRQWREKNNAAMSLGWRVWHYAPEEVIKAGRKIDSRADIRIIVSPAAMRNPTQ